MDWHTIFKLLLLLWVANGVPILVAWLLGPRLDWPVDAGLKLPDNQPLFGASKTWRGVCLSIVVTGLFSWLLHMPILVGALLALSSMLGDLVSSFIKRRMQMLPSSRAIVLDQIPESLLPLLVLGATLKLSAIEILVIVGLFLVTDVALSRILHRLHIRKRPY